ncbi:putative methionyl-tRNA synthetase [Hordeum vulgare]|nr:putative methionyl-tRNA synthetase [Hordeum vulgare]
MYCTDNKDQEFKFLHMFSGIESCEKWREVRLALEKAKETYSPDAPSPSATKGRSDGTRKARAARVATPAVERLQALIEQCIANIKNSAARREEKSDERCSALMINVAAKKRNTDLGFLMEPDTSTMDEKVKALYIVQRDLILSHMPAPAATTTVTTTAAPTTTPSPSAETTLTTSQTTPTTN